ncbi:hypothetical protein [Calidifontibacter indicus]|uniref:hypothetical protein n=1 Tax=Calidifontibacter indicus TaxID=419650 RepID=UPI003D715341
MSLPRHTAAGPAVGVRVDAGGRMGVGHAVRCLALTQEMRGRGVDVTVYGSLDVPWVRNGYERAGVPVESPGKILDATLTHVVIDGYDVPASLGESLRSNGIHVTALVDDAFGAHQIADLYVDQNYGAQPHIGGPAGSTALAGVPYALFRDEILAARSAEAHAADGVPRVLAVFGGTDPFGASDLLVPMLLDTGEPLQLLVLCPDPDRADHLRALPRAAGQEVEVVASVPDIAAAAAASDLAVSAAGSTVWELLTIGTPTAVVCVVDNQEPGYRATTDDGLVLPAGRLPALAAGDAAERSAAVAALRRLLTEPELRTSLRVGGMRLFDGRGRARVADAMGVRKPEGSA